MESLRDLYETYWHEKADQRILEWPYMKSPIPVITILAIYWILLKKGPKWMENKPAYNIKPIIQAYNVFQVIACTICGVRVTHLILKKDFWCINNPSTSEHDMAVVFYSWMYMMTKVADMCDTLFFVLRKKFNLISTLHVYHHFSMVLLTYLLIRYYPGGELSAIIALNSLVHTVMYSYYFYCMNNDGRQNVWWKKHITHLQIGQFCFLATTYLYKLFFVKDCGYPKSIVVFCTCNTLLLLQMFLGYYYHAFIKTKKPKCDQNANANMNKQRKTA